MMIDEIFFAGACTPQPECEWERCDGTHNNCRDHTWTDMNCISVDRRCWEWEGDRGVCDGACS